MSLGFSGSSPPVAERSDFLAESIVDDFRLAGALTLPREIGLETVKIRSAL